MQNFIFIAAALMSTAVNGAYVPSYNEKSSSDTCLTPGPTSSSPATPSSTGGSPNTCGSTTFTNYTVVSGDTLGAIATKYKSGICDIAKANNIANPDLIFPGEVLTIPANCVTPDNDSCINHPGTCVAGVGATYTVQSGDSLSRIASDFNITLPALEAANPAITNPDLIFPGQVLNVPICPNSVCDSIGTYAIQSGDTYSGLATANGIVIGQIESLNQNANASALAIGQIIILPHNCHNATAA